MTYDFAPLFRTAIGFDRLASLMDTAVEAASTPAYPPYNIEKVGEDRYRLTVAVAGFGPEDIDLVVRDNTLTVTGKPAQAAKDGELLYRGIAGRAFERRNGLLSVELARVVPETLKPRRIAIGGRAPELTADHPTAGNDTTSSATKAA